MKNKRRVFKILAIIVAAVILLTCGGGVAIYAYSVEQNKTIVVTPYTVSHKQIPASFGGKRIVQVSDLHNKDFGDQMIQAVAKQDPDIIVITGDWISRNTRDDITPAKRQAEALTQIAPVYYVTGNHEAWASRWSELYIALLECGVTVMENDALLWEENGEAVQLLGMFDPEFSAHLVYHVEPNVKEEYYNILLMHRPEYAPDAAACGIDLMFSGHTHGGQIRLPLIGSLYAPDQGWFPEYDVGRFEVGDMTMILTQGLGEATSMRILTPPEIVVVTLQSEHT